jgi:hypothetical protein
LKALDLIGKPTYGFINNGLYGKTIISGVITGVRFTEEEPVYEVSFGNNKWWVTEITDHITAEHLNLPTLEKVKTTHGLKTRFEA